MLCPVCKIELTMAERQGVEIDYCPQCRGIWLDRGELDKIIERSAAPAAPAARFEPQVRQDSRYQEGHHDSHHSGDNDHKRKSRSFLSEIFDFG